MVVSLLSAIAPPQDLGSWAQVTYGMPNMRCQLVHGNAVANDRSEKKYETVRGAVNNVSDKRMH